jgi:predicted acetyltransferase
MTAEALTRPARPPSAPVELVPASRHDRAVLENLGQLYRHDLSEALGLMPNQDGTFNNRRLDAFRTGENPEHRAWLITAAGKLAGFVMTDPHEDGSMTIDDFFVVRALRRTGVGRDAARQTIARFPGPWRIGFQRYNPGVERFWTQVASEFVGEAWTLVDEQPPPADRPPDTWLIFTTS